jgi:hypothetical protein
MRTFYQVGSQAGNQIMKNIKDQAFYRIDNQVSDLVLDQVGRQVWRQVGIQVIQAIQVLG